MSPENNHSPKNSSANNSSPQKHNSVNQDVTLDTHEKTLDKNVEKINFDECEREIIGYTYNYEKDPFGGAGLMMCRSCNHPIIVYGRLVIIL